jgi:hypothetical protein
MADEDRKTLEQKIDFLNRRIRENETGKEER